MNSIHYIVAWTDDKGNVKFYKRIEAHTLVQLAAKFGLTVAELAEQMKEEALREQRKVPDDDIPF
jgi:hypothetical protein